MMILSTKLLNNSIIKKAKQEFGYDLVCKSFTRIKEVDFVCSPYTIQSYDGFAFTSANAVHYFLENINTSALAKKSIFALQGATRRELLSRDIIPNIIAPNVDELGKLIKLKHEAIRVQKVLHPTGNLTLSTLRDILIESGLSYQDINVYKTELNPIPIDAYPYKAVLFFSPSAIDSFSMVNRFLSERIYVCIGQTTLTRLRFYTQTSNVVIARSPTPEAMLIALYKKLKNKDE